MKEIVLPSGAKLQILTITFVEAKALYQAILEEARTMSLSASTDFAAMIKDLFCIGFSSKKIESALKVCLSKCLYDGLKIDDGTFEPLQAREDYSIVCIEVIEDTIRPFTKGLSVKLGQLVPALQSART